MADARVAAKIAAAQGALEVVRQGYRANMVLGLGTGSTAEQYVELLAQVVRQEQWQVTCVPTSEAIADFGRARGLIMDASYPDFRGIDITVDGADEVDGQGNLIKGGGGALLREKYVALASRRMVVIVDEAKHVKALGTTFRLPVEIVSFAWSNTLERLRQFGWEVSLRRAKTPDQGKYFVTDQGNYIADCVCGAITQPLEQHLALKALPGVVETGIFPNIAYAVVTGKADGTSDLRILKD